MTSRRWLLLLVSGWLLSACLAGTPATAPLLQAEPAIGSTLQRAPRTLRLYFAALPDVSHSSLRLIGAQGEVPLRGLHTMASDDLMVEIMAPLSNGRYRVEWVTLLEGDADGHAGAYEFTVAVPR